MNGNTFRTLEFETIRALLLAQTGSAAGRGRLDELAPAVDLDTVRARLARTSEAVLVLARAGRQPFHDLPDIADVLPAARVAGVQLEPGALADVASFVEGSTGVAQSVAGVADAPALSRLAASVSDTREVAQAIRRAILPSGEVADDASPRLGEVRRAMARLRAQLHSVMEGYLRDRDTERLLQDKLVTTRNDRYVLLVKAEHRSALPGIIHGSSGSGASLFVEPLPAVELNNDIVSLQDEERREVARILKDLTARVGARADEIAAALDVMGQLDALQAMALLARDMGAVEPEVTAEARLELRDARHPLLMRHLTERVGVPRRTSKEPVPVTIRVGGGTPVLVISGPNTGGKTVALKTVGLLALMAQCGLHVPAAEGSVLPVFRRLYADIGDEQSIAENLSTFSAHLAAIVQMTRDLERPALVLLDEVGAGTDPTEGGALAVAIVDHFRRRGAMVVATTHHGVMKAYAQSTAGVACASFGYVPGTYEPTYRLSLGAPGRSLALEMADRLGLPSAIVQDARARMDETTARTEALLKDLEEQKATIARERGEATSLRAAAAEARARAEAAAREIAAGKKLALEAFSRELKKRGEEAARKAADAIRETVARLEASRRSTPAAAAKARSEAIAGINAAEAEALREAGIEAPEAAVEAPLAVGVRARVRDLGVAGEVLALAGDEVELAVGSKRLRVPRASVTAVGGGNPGSAERTRTPSRPRGGGVATLERDGSAHGTFEVNVVGLRVHEAIDRVDKALDDAVVASRSDVRIVHGFGEGKLRKAVAELLDGHPHVSSFRPGGPGEGGGGATIAELKG